MTIFQIDHRSHVHAGVVANRGVRAAAGFHTDNSISRQHAFPQQEFGILAGVDIVGNHGQRDLVLQPLA